MWLIFIITINLKLIWIISKLLTPKPPSLDEESLFAFEEESSKPLSWTEKSLIASEEELFFPSNKKIDSFLWIIVEFFPSWIDNKDDEEHALFIVDFSSYFSLK